MREKNAAKDKEHGKGKRTRRRKKNAAREARPAQLSPIPPPHTFSHGHRGGDRLPLQGCGRQLLQAEVLRNELVVHLVAEVPEPDGFKQPEVVHHLQARQLDVARAVAGVNCVPPHAVRPTGQVKHSVPVRRALDLVLGQSEGGTHRNLMPPDPQAAHLGGEGGGKDRDAVVVDALERLVLDRVPLE